MVVRASEAEFAALNSRLPAVDREPVHPRCDIIEFMSLLSVQTPGPGQYGIPDTDMYKKKSPGYTMIGRQETSSKDITPGPGAHANDNVNHLLHVYYFYLY